MIEEGSCILQQWRAHSKSDCFLLGVFMLSSVHGLCIISLRFPMQPETSHLLHTTSNESTFSRAPPAVVEAYAQLSKHVERKKLLLAVLLYFLARVDEEHPENQREKHLEDMSAFGTIFEETWKTLAMEGTISEERWNSFNLPCYAASMNEVKAAVNATDVFHIKQLQVEELRYLEEAEEKQLRGDPEAYGRFHSGFIAGMMPSHIENHIGQEKGEKFFQRVTTLAATAARENHITRLAVACTLVVLIRK